MTPEEIAHARAVVSRWERDAVCPALEELAVPLARALEEMERLQGALKGSRCKANVMSFLWQAAEEEMRSDDPVEVRLRKDLEDADEAYQALCKEKAAALDALEASRRECEELRAEVERLQPGAFMCVPLDEEQAHTSLAFLYEEEATS